MAEEQAWREESSRVCRSLFENNRRSDTRDWFSASSRRDLPRILFPTRDQRSLSWGEDHQLRNRLWADSGQS